MNRDCATFRKTLGESDPHLESCADCREAMASLLGAEAILRAGKTELPAGFAAEVARVALRRPKRATTSFTQSLVDRLIPVAVPTAALSVVCALALAFGLGWNGSGDQQEPLEDPLEQAVELPETLSDPTLALLGDEG